MKNMLNVTAKGDREIVMTRSFAAPRGMVYDALTRPALIKRWLGVFGGWTMPVCEVDLRVGGRYRYLWRGPNGEEMGMGGVYRELVPSKRIVSTEKFDQSWYPGEAVGTAVFDEQDGTTTLTITVLYDSRDARDTVLKSPMEQGAGASYDNLEKFLAGNIAQETK
jgi:uncharacterized protein YndB with AHSA1/START domain